MRFCVFFTRRSAASTPPLIWTTLALFLICGCGGDQQHANLNSKDSGQPVPALPATVTDKGTDEPNRETPPAVPSNPPAKSAGTSTDAASNAAKPPPGDAQQPAENLSGVNQVSQQLLFDFDRTTLSKNWTATGKIHVAQKALPAALEFDGEHPIGNGLAITAEAKSSIQCKSDRIPKDWRGHRELIFWVYRSAQESEKHEVSTIDIHLYEADGKTRFSSRVDLSHAGWKKISLPLRWFRWGSSRIAQWDRIDRMQFWFRGPAEISFDTIWLTPGDNSRSAYLDSNDLRWVAFPNGGGRLLESQHVVVITDAAQLKIELLANHLGQVEEAIRQDFPFFESFMTAPTLLVFSTREDYQAFVPRFGKQFNAVARPPQSSGYSLLGVSLSYWDEQFGSLRPVYSHEYIHGVMSRCALLPSTGGWFHEGTATMYQLRFHPQDNLQAIIKEGMSETRLHLPLDQLCNGKRILTNRYWQALTVVEMLLENKRYREHLPDLLSAFRREGSTDIGPHLKTELSTDWETLTADWYKFCRQKYGATIEAAEPATTP